MKFIQKMLASLFAVLLMVTVIAPNVVFAEEEEITENVEVPTLRLHGGKFTVDHAAGLFVDEESPVSYYRVAGSLSNIGNNGYTFNSDGIYTVRASNNRYFTSGVVSKEVNVDVYNEITATVEGLPEETEASVFANEEVINGVYTTDPATAYEITASDVEGYVYDVYDGNRLLTSALKDNKDHNLIVKYTDLNTIGTVVVNNSVGGRVEASVAGRVNAGETVKLTTSVNDNYRLVSVKVNGDEVENNAFTVEGGKTYTVEGVFEEVTAVLDDMPVDYYMIKDGVNANNKGDVEAQILDGLKADEELVAALKSGDVKATVTYKNGALSYGSVDYKRPSWDVLKTTHAFGNVDDEVTVGNTESVRVVLTGTAGGAKINMTLDATATVSDMRPETAVKANRTVRITYGDNDLKEKVLNAITVVDEEGNDVVATLDEISIDNEYPNATLLLPTEVAVTFNGRGEDYGISQGTVKVYVSQAKTEFDVKSQNNVPYDGQTHELEVRTTPVNDKGVGYVTVYGGIDGDARGYGSIIISPALRNNLKVDLKQFNVLPDTILDIIAAGGSGLQNIIVPLLPAEIKDFAYAIDFSDMTIDVFKVIETMFKDGVKLDAMSETLERIAGLVKTVTGIAGAGSENGADISKVVDTIMDALTQVSDTVKIPMTVYLNQAPKNVGAYVVTGVVADLNYQFRMDVADLIIVPNTDVVLTWNQEMEDNTFSYKEFVNDFGGFNFGATLNDGAGKPFESTGDQEHVQILYTGLDTEFNPVLDLNSLEDVINAGPGIYTETAVTVGGNYFAKPITRTFIIEREEVTIENESVEVTYNGKTQSIGDVVVSCDGECEDDLAAKAIVIYTRNGFPVTNPIYAGEYSVLITVPGDANHKTAQKRVTLTIEKDVVTIGSESETQTTTYNKEAHNYEYTVTCDNPAGEDATVCPEVARRVKVTYYNEEGTALKGAPVNAGTYRVVVEYPGDWNHEAAEYEGTLVINKKQVYVPQVPNVSVRYDGKEHGFIFDCTEEELALIEEAVQITYRNTNGRRVSTPKNVGRYFGDTTLKDPANYEYAEGSADRSIVVDIYRANPEVVITVSDAVYDGQPHGATEVVVVDDCENETLPTVVRYYGVLGTSYNSSKAPVNAGNYVVVAGYAGDWNHNADSSMKAFTIKKADVIIVPTEVEVYYDGEEHAAEYEVCCTNNTETPTPACDDVMDDVYVMYTDPNTGNSYTGESELPVNAGEYAAEVRYPGDRNHNPAKAETKVIIKKAEVKVTLYDASAVYGETPVLTKTVTVENGKFDTTKLNITPEISDPENAYPNVGEYDITASYTPNANVVVTVETATLTVTPKTVTVVIDNQTKKTGKADPEFTWNLSEDSEMAFEEDPSELGVELSREDVSEKAGTYEISGTWTNGNYNVVFVNGTLTIRKPAAPNVNYVVPNTSAK